MKKYLDNIWNNLSDNLSSLSKKSITIYLSFNMNNPNKIFSFVFIILFLIVFSFYNFEEYKSFHQDKLNTEKNEKTLKQELINFDLEELKELSDVKFYYTPNKDLLNNIVELINNAKENIYLETYMLTEKRIQEALIKAKKREISIKIILEKSPYKASNINNSAYNNMEKNWIEIQWSNKDNYSLNHSKVLIIDNLSIISSGNFTYSTFTQNRDFFIFTYDTNINKSLVQNFNNDFLWIKTDIFNDNLVFSPKTSRIKFNKLFDKAENNIKMYFQYMLDDEFVNKLIDIKKIKKIDIWIILADTALSNENTIKLENNWIKIEFIKKPKIHAKAILIDDKYLYVWSINMSDNSIDKNREIWILLKEKNIIKEFIDIYNSDTNN